MHNIFQYLNIKHKQFDLKQGSGLPTAANTNSSTKITEAKYTKLDL